MVSGDVVLYADDDNYYLGEAFASFCAALGDPMPDWGIFPMDKFGELFCDGMPGRGRTDTNQIFHKPIVAGTEIRFPALPDYDADGLFAERLAELVPMTVIDTGRPLVRLEIHKRGEP
jgi:hypothetical protein